MYSVYVIYSRLYERYYIGLSKQIRRRLREHNTGHVKSTKAFVPWELVCHEDYEILDEARIREKYLKSAAGRRWRKQNIRPRSSTG